MTSKVNPCAARVKGSGSTSIQADSSTGPVDRHGDLAMLGYNFFAFFGGIYRFLQIYTLLMICTIVNVTPFSMVVFKELTSLMIK